MKTSHVLVIGLFALAASACRGNSPEEGVAASIDTGGNAARGRAVIQEYDCGSCHTIPGVRGADGLVAPPLLWFARRTYVAGEVPNTPDNLAQWVRQPWSIEPTTAMPDLGLDERQARDVVAYLYTLR
ncbi:MAG TPA: c-type cytochrome [Vicinamibacterales bacterium]|nr:c-type cytochrome [Vicinamibacterales bacterium]